MWGLGKSNFSVAYKHEHIVEKIIRGKKRLIALRKNPLEMRLTFSTVGNTVWPFSLNR